jgi:hypothetical protein
MISMTKKIVNPDSIIISNQYYKSLTENDVYRYYIKNKNNILEQVIGRDLIFFIIPDVNISIVKRIDKNSSSGFIQLNKENYEKIIHGRVISIHSSMKEYEDFGIIDIDGLDFDKNKIVVQDIYDHCKKYSDIKDIKIRYTGKDSFHIICYFHKKDEIRNIKEKLVTILNIPEIINKYPLSPKRIPGKINLDLSPNKINGGFITLHSLSVLGLKCMEVDIDKLKTFNKNLAKIK